jgi:hypothetical protein
VPASQRLRQRRGLPGAEHHPQCTFTDARRATLTLKRSYPTIQAAVKAINEFMRENESQATKNLREQISLEGRNAPRRMQRGLLRPKGQ